MNFLWQLRFWWEWNCQIKNINCLTDDFTPAFKKINLQNQGKNKLHNLKDFQIILVCKDRKKKFVSWPLFSSRSSDHYNEVTLNSNYFILHRVVSISSIKILFEWKIKSFKQLKNEHNTTKSPQHILLKIDLNLSWDVR